ncbi:MAG: NADH:ubiquinone oxidoreductase [Candidatus Marinimicrobia bacterium]|nr:NADH:ubiquinone oxidoreductase [Candidatus Neomarinimicrobiota bacterium]
MSTQTALKTKPQIAFFDFTSCEGCQLNKLDLENHLLEILEHVDIVEFREAMDDKADAYDIAFIEGSISTPSCIERIHDIRRRAKILVALGSCASIGGINAMKNLQPIEDMRETVYGEDKYLFPTLPAMPVSAIVKVDYEIHGCPMSIPEFLVVFKALVMGKQPIKPDSPVCVECKLRENECLYDRGMVCLGPITRSGCDAICPSFGQFCTGCRGLVPDANKNAMLDILTDHGLSLQEAEKRLLLFNSYKQQDLFK